MTKTKVRTRIAPSPTGIPHIGTARQALFDYLLAKKYKGKFILRIEDTDQKRFVPGSIEAMYKINEFLGHTPDEGPYFQTKRLKFYKKYAKQLIKNGTAYEDEGAIRIKMPKTGYTTWKDLIQGKISIPNEEVDDKVLLKSDGIPTYHLAVVIDDHLMEISHVIRGAEWIVSTPVHLLLYQALGWTPPIFMHTPLILGPDKAKLGKRHGAKNVLQYKDEGYLPEAINNFLLYLGFSYKDNSDILSMKEMIKIFNENKISKSNAIFDIQKLDYFNSKWIKKLNISDLTKRLTPFIDKNWQKNLSKIIPLVKDRLTKLSEINNLIDFFFKFSTPTQENLLANSQASPAITLSWLNTVKDNLKDLKDFQPESIHELLKKAQGLSDLSPRQAFMSLRLAVTGKIVTPPLFDCIAILGKKETLSRLQKSVTLLK
ncbi:glutamate--tRNA ligase [Patescibacteria group bacterium]|nr:glutamate--tRNA ligase [Patescibacteria group bacterium]